MKNSELKKLALLLLKLSESADNNFGEAYLPRYKRSLTNIGYDNLKNLAFEIGSIYETETNKSWI